MRFRCWIMPFGLIMSLAIGFLGGWVAGRWQTRDQPSTIMKSRMTQLSVPYLDLVEPAGAFRPFTAHFVARRILLFRRHSH